MCQQVAFLDVQETDFLKERCQHFDFDFDSVSASWHLDPLCVVKRKRHQDGQLMCPPLADKFLFAG